MAWMNQLQPGTTTIQFRLNMVLGTNTIPDPDFQDGREQLRFHGGVVTKGNDQLLLQHGQRNVVGRAGTVDARRHLIRSQRFVDNLLFVSKHAHGDLTCG